MNNYWEIRTGNGVTTTNRTYKVYVVELCGRKLKANMIVLDTGRYDVIIGMTLFSKYHVVIDYRNKRVIFIILHQLEFQLIGECKSTKDKE